MRYLKRTFVYQEWPWICSTSKSFEIFANTTPLFNMLLCKIFRPTYVIGSNIIASYTFFNKIFILLQPAFQTGA